MSNTPQSNKVSSNDETEASPQDKSKLNIKKKTDTYLKYSSWGYTLFGLMLGAIIAGQYADDYYNLDKPYVTLSLLGIVIFAKFYTLIKDLA